jgi:hypothetical protein
MNSAQNTKLNSVKINQRIITLLVMSAIALGLQLIFFWGLPPDILERILYISSGIFFTINLFILSSQYTPGIITDFAGNGFDATLKQKVAAGMIATVFLFLGVCVFAGYLLLHYFIN